MRKEFDANFSIELIDRTNREWISSARYRKACEEITRLDAEVERLARYDKLLSAEMNPDFKDWFQNSREEWPVVAAWVIHNLREQLADQKSACTTKRWEPAVTGEGYNFGDAVPTMEETPAGDWVRYEDYARTRKLLAEACEYVANAIAEMERIYIGHPALLERKSKPDRELLAMIDTELSEGETMRSYEGNFTSKELVQSILIDALRSMLEELDKCGADSFIGGYDKSDAFRALVRKELVDQHNALLEQSGLSGVSVG